MGFFAEFSSWLDALLSTYIGDTTARLSSALEPTIITVGTIYVMIWGTLHLAGKIEEPVLEGLRRIATLGVVFGLSISLWHYHDVLVAIFFDGPGQLAAAAINAPDFTTVIDTILDDGDDVGSALLSKAGSFHWNLAYDLAAVAVYLTVGITAVYTMFLLTLSKIALSVLLALGPAIVPLFMFDATRRFCEAWLAQLCNYVFVSVLAALVSALMISVVEKAIGQAQSTGGGVQIANAVRICLAAGFTFLVLRQVLSMASALSSGVALSTMGIVSSVIGRASQKAFGGTKSFVRGAVMDKDATRWDPLSRMSGFYFGKGIRKIGNTFGKGNSAGPGS